MKIEAPVPQRISPLGRGVRADEVSENDNCHILAFVGYYHRTRTHLGLQKDAPEPRAKQPPECGLVVEIAEVGGLPHRYERRAA